jgi:hypothetical protein
MKRYTATIRISIEAETIEARDHLLETVAGGITKKRPAVRFVDVGSAQINRAVVTRARPRKR